jgi:manganese-dependent inorganic pyrophosphatase
VDAVAACCGEISVRTAWVLQQAGLEAPRLLLDVRPTAGMLARRQVVTATPEATLIEVNRRMLDKDFRAIPVVDDEGRLVGMPSLAEMAELLMPPRAGEDNQHRRVRTSLANIAQALDARKAGEAESSRLVEEMILMVAASSEETTRQRAAQFDPRKVILLVGDRPEIHAMALELGVRGLVVTGGFTLSPEMEAAAQQKRIALVLTNHDTASSAQLIRFSRPISDALRPGLISFKSSTPLAEILPIAQHSQQPLFPVIDEDTGLLMGVFSKSDLIDPPRTKLVLVDHNEFAQAVSGADEADILEVIDHHRLSGNLRTKEPIRFINEPVGSTSTIVALMHRMRNMTPDKPVALCLCAGIISDTLNLTSPTTTNTDRDILAWLSALAGIQTEHFVQEFFAAGSMLKDLSPAAAVESDRKEFSENGWRISISQIEELGLDEFWKREDGLQLALQNVCHTKNVHFACLMVTDITEHNSVLLVAGDQRLADAIEYPQKGRHLFHMPGVVSRKKQLFPYLGRLLGKTVAPPQ